MQQTTRTNRQARIQTQFNRNNLQSGISHKFNPVKIVCKLIQYVVAMVGILCGFGMLLMLFILFICVRPFSRRLYRRLAANIAVSSFLDAMALILPNTRICLTPESDIFSPFGTSILVCNHSLQGLDWWVLMMLGRCMNLHGSIRIFMKRKVSGGTCEYRQYPPLNILTQMLEYPLLPSMHDKDYVQDRSGLLQLLCGFSEESCCNGGYTSGNNPAHFLLFPDCTDYNGNMAEVSKREGRPQLRHLNLPRSTGLNASLESLRPSSPVVYDITMAHIGYNGKIENTDCDPWTLFWRLVTDTIPEIHIRIKRKDMEDVLQDSNWLDKCWAEKDRILEHFYRHQCFPRSGSNKQYRIFDTKYLGVESSLVALFRLMMMPILVPIFLVVSIPLAWTVGWFWLAYQAYILLFDREANTNLYKDNSGLATPFVPATPFVSPIAHQ